MPQEVFDTLTRRLEELECMIIDRDSKITSLNAEIDKLSKEYNSIAQFIANYDTGANKGNSEAQKPIVKELNYTEKRSILDIEVEAQKLGLDYETYVQYMKNERRVKKK